jgi:hypothetical protein
MTVNRNIVVGVIAGVITGALSCATARAQQASPETTSPKTVTNTSTTLEKENVHTEGVHHYQDPAEEAEDAALITKSRPRSRSMAWRMGIRSRSIAITAWRASAEWSPRLMMRSMRPRSPLPSMESRGSITS